MNFETTLYLGLLIAVTVPTALLIIALVATAWWEKRKVRQAVHLADRRIAILPGRKAATLERALHDYLRTPAGKAVAADPRITARLELFSGLTFARDIDRTQHLRRKAEAELLLAPLFETA